MRHHFVKIVLPFLIALSACAGFLLLYAPFWHARRFLRDTLTLEVGSSTFLEAERLARKYGGQVIQVGDVPPTCSSNSCVFKFAFGNVWLHRLGLAPFTTFGGEVRVSDNIVVSRELAMAVERRDYYLEVFSKEAQELKSGTAVRVVQYLKLPRLGIETTPSAPQEVRVLSHQFSLKCLIRIRGCTSAEELLPSLQELKQAGYAIQSQR